MFLVLPLQQTDFWVEQIERSGVHPTGIVVLWFVFGVTWPIDLSLLPSFRQLLLLPLSARDVGAVLLLLRVGVPCLGLGLLMIADLALGITVIGPPAHPFRTIYVLACLSAAFPVMVLIPFLPLPGTAWRAENGYPSFGLGSKPWRIAAAGAVWLAGPAIATIPFLTMDRFRLEGAAASALIGGLLLTLAWRRREALVLASFRSDRLEAGTHAAAGRRGWSALGRWLLMRLGWSAAFGLLFPAFLLSVRHGAPDPNFLTGFVIFSGSSMAFVVFLPLLTAIRALRLLPISCGSLSVILLLGFALPPLAGMLAFLSATAFLPGHLRPAAGHSAAMALFCVACDMICIAPTISVGQRRPGVLWLPAAAVQFVAILLILPSDGWLFVLSLLLLGASAAWLTRTLQITMPRRVMAG
jgi:hypothetical protein